MVNIDYRLGDYAQNKAFASALAAVGGGGGSQGYYIGAHQNSTPAVVCTPSAGMNPFGASVVDPFSPGKVGSNNYYSPTYSEYATSGDILANFDEYYGFTYVSDGVYLSTVTMTLNGTGSIASTSWPGSMVRLQDNNNLYLDVMSPAPAPSNIATTWVSVQKAGDYNFMPGISFYIAHQTLQISNAWFTTVKIG